MRLEEYDWPARPGVVPFKHQKHTVVFLLENKRAFILNDMGTGKTLSALWACDILFCELKIRRVLVICPLSTMRSVWQREIFLNFPKRKVIIAHGSPDIRRRAIRSQYEYTVINHDGIKSMEDEIAKAKFDIIIIDELTAFKSFDADRTKCMIRLARTPRALWGMTGKPTPNKAIEAFSQAHIVNPLNRYLPRYFTQFRDMVSYKLNLYTWVDRPEAPNIVASVLQPAIRYKITDCIDMPPMVTETLEIPLTQAQSKAYEQMKEHLVIEMKSGLVTAANAAVKLNKLLQISAGSVITDDGEATAIECGPRLQATYDLWESTPQGKLVIFANFRASIHMLQEYLTKKGLEVGSIYGDVSSKDRDKHISNFQDGSLQVLIIQPQSAAHGITLTAASTLLWFSLIPSNEFYQQGNARIYRPGQTYPCTIVHMVSTPAEKRVAKMLIDKDFRANTVLSMLMGDQEA